MAVRIRIRRDTFVRFSTVNPILNEGELAYEKDTGRFKLGDGVTPWNSLPYLTIAEANDILNRLKTVDGHNSGLDADFVDGYHASQFALSDHTHTGYVSVSDYEDVDVLNKIKNVDGHDSGLDADLLDGYHASTDKISNSWYNRIPVIDSDGNVNIGSKLNFHVSDNSPHISVYPVNDRFISIKTYSNRDKYISFNTPYNTYIYIDNVNGSDSSGDGSNLNPFASISRALSELGEFYSGNITIIFKNTGTSYGDINISGFIRRNHLSSITIRGEMVQLDSGTISSHSNSIPDPVYGSSVQVSRIIPSGTKNWLDNQYRHKLLRVYSGSTSYYRIITWNDSNSIYTSYSFPVIFDSGWNYEILDWGTEFSSITINNCFGSINIDRIKVISSSDSSNISISDSSQYCNVTNCYIKPYSSQSYGIIVLNRSCLYISSSYIDCNNVFVNAISMDIPSNYLEVTGCVFDNSVEAPIYFNYSNDRITLSGGNRFYEGNSNPSTCINSLGGIIYVLGNYGKSVIDAGITGISLTRNAVIQGSGNIFFGPNVDIPISSCYGSIDGGKLMVCDYFSINETDYRNVHSRFTCNGSVATGVNTVTSDIILGANHHIVLADASNNNITITLPYSSSCKGRQYVIKKSDSSSNNVVINPQSTENIDGEPSISLSKPNESIVIFSDGFNWRRMVFSQDQSGTYIPSSNYLAYSKFEFDSEYRGVDSSIAFGMIPCYSFSPFERGRIWGVFKNIFHGANSVSFSIGYTFEGIQNDRTVKFTISIYGLSNSGVTNITSDTFSINTGTDQTRYYILNPSSPVISSGDINSYHAFIIAVDRRTDLSEDNYDGYLKLIDFDFIVI